MKKPPNIRCSRPLLRYAPQRCAGEKVEVVILSRSYKPKGKERYPLRGKPIRYIAPFESVAENDWTHIWVWWVHGDKQLSQTQFKVIAAHETEVIGINAISCWEIAKLVEFG